MAPRGGPGTSPVATSRGAEAEHAMMAKVWLKKGPESQCVPPAVLRPEALTLPARWSFVRVAIGGQAVPRRLEPSPA